jgi:hypothetical protein
VITRIDQARPAVIYGLIVVLMAAVFVPMSQFRLVDGDEGTYLLDARLVMEGYLPFHDLFWPQMFLTPYIYGAWMAIFGKSWYGARFFSALAAIALGLILFRQVFHIVGRRTWAVLAVVLFTFTSLEFGWLPLIKTFAFGTLCLFSAYAVLSLSASRFRWVVSGLLVGLAIDIRLYVVFALPAFLIELYFTEPRLRERLMQLARFTVGLIIAMLPNWFFYLVEPETFLFNIIYVHAIRSPWGFFGYLQQKLDIALQLLSVNSAEGVTSFQFTALLLVNLASWVSSAITRERPSLATMILVPHLLASLVPTPTYTQYFSMTVPFLIVNAVTFLAKLFAECGGARLRHVFATLLAAYILVAPLDVYRYTVGGVNVPGISYNREARNWTIPTIRAVGQAIDREIRPERPVAISFWPGYFVETRASIFPKMENHFTIDFALSMTPRDVRKFNFMSYPELVGNLQIHTVDVVVLGNWVTQRRWVREQVVGHGYELVGKVEDAEIYKLAPSVR